MLVNCSAHMICSQMPSRINDVYLHSYLIQCLSYLSTLASGSWVTMVVIIQFTNIKQ